MTEDLVIREILDCDQNLFKDLRDNLNLIAQADKDGLSPSEYNARSFSGWFFNSFNLFQATNPINTSQIVLKSLYEHFGRRESSRAFKKI